MECLVMERHSLPRGSDAVDAAFMTGMLSMLDVLLGVSIEEVILQLRLSDEIATALLDHEGELGILLELTENLEQTKLDEVQLLVEKIGMTNSTLLAAQLDAYNWRAGIRNDT
jgi:EAL and modified HD-GYP domain-containing signal transduction protein